MLNKCFLSKGKFLGLGLLVKHRSGYALDYRLLVITVDRTITHVTIFKTNSLLMLSPQDYYLTPGNKP